MPLNLNFDRPIFVQIIEHIENDIVTGKYNSGDKLPSVRDLAAEAGVTPNTIQKALSDLEHTGLVHSERTSGRFITEDENMIKDLRTALIDMEIEDFFNNMKRLGFDEEQIIQLVEQFANK